MQELEEMKLKVAEIKLASMEREFEKANATYTQTIKTLKYMLAQKTEKQLKLLHDLQILKNDHAAHNQSVQEALQKIKPRESPSKPDNYSQQSLARSKPRLRKLNLKEVSQGQKSIDGKSQSASSAQYNKEKNSGRPQGAAKLYNNEFLNLRRRHEQLKKKSNIDGTLETPKKPIRGSYDVPSSNKVQSQNTKWLRASEKVIKKEAIFR